MLFADLRRFPIDQRYLKDILVENEKNINNKIK
jgi:hypothetical protein